MSQLTINPTTETDLTQAIQNRSAAASAIFYDRYAPLLYKIILITVKDKGRAENLLEETVLIIWDNIKDFQGENLRFTLWMAGIAKRLALQEIRKSLSEIEVKEIHGFIPVINGIALQ